MLRPMMLFQDNQSTIRLFEREMATNEMSKHIETKYFNVKDLVERRLVKVDYVPTNLMVADILTKAVQGENFATLRDVLLGQVDK